MTVSRSWDIPQKGKDGKAYPPIRESVTIQQKIDIVDVGRVYSEMNDIFFNMRKDHFNAIKNKGNGSSGGRRDYTNDFE